MTKKPLSRMLVCAAMIGTATTSVSVTSTTPAGATPVACSKKKVNATTGSATCSGGTGKVRVVLRCTDNFDGTSSTQYGPYVGIGQTSTHQCYPAQRSGLSYVDYQTSG